MPRHEAGYGCLRDIEPVLAIQVSRGRFVFRFKMANDCRKARFSRASSRCDLKLDLAVERRPKISSNMREREPASDGKIINDCASHGVLRRHRCREPTSFVCCKPI